MVNVSEKAQKKLGRTTMEDLQKDGYILSEREIISTPVPTKEVRTPVVLHFKYGELATPDVDDLLDGGVDPDHISRINQSGFDKPEQACAWLRHLRTLKLSNQGIRFLRATGKATNKKGANLFIREVKANAPKEQKAIEDNRLLKLAKTHQSFSDPSIAAQALGIVPKDLIYDLNTFGLMFETMCIRDLRIYADALGGRLYHYRDKSGLECDAVLHLNNGDYGLIEIKLCGDTLIEHGAKTLKELAGRIDTGRMHAPSFLMVLTGTDSYAYQRKDGVYVVPLGCLRE